MRYGIDLGGSKIEIIALNEQGDACFRHRVATPQGNYQATLTAIAALFQLAVAEFGPGSLGIGTPGAISPATGLLKNSNSTCLNGQPLLEDLQRLVGQEIRMANDANCFALSEAVDGAAAGAEVVFGVIIGTGTGAGVVVRQRPLLGSNAIAGEWGHNPMPWPEADEQGTVCYCGQKGCIETFLSGPGFSNHYQTLGGEPLSALEIVQRADHGEQIAQQALQRYYLRLAKSLAHIINMLDPDVIVLGGGMSNISALYAHVPQLWQDYVFSDVVLTRLVSPKYGDSSGVRGAAWLWE